MDSAAYSDTVASIFDAVLDERRTPAALKAAAEYVGASGATFLLVNKLTRQVSTMAWWGSFTGSRADYLAHYGDIDPFRMIQESTAGESFARLSECLPQSVLRQDEWYNDFLLKGGVRDILGGKLHESRSHTVIVGFRRAVGDAHPLPRNGAALQLLMGPMRNAARLHTGLIGIGYSSPITRGTLGHVATGIVFTHGDGRIVETNHAGERILRIGDGLTMRNGHIGARRGFETTKLTYLIARAVAPQEGGGPSAGCLLVARGDGQPPYVVRVAPVSAGLAGYDSPMAMLLVSSTDENRVSERELAELYGLSPAESRIAVALARGKRMTDLTGELGVQITTLRTQLSSILKKCEVERQSDLIRLIGSIPVVRSAQSETDPL
jgi:DNA-binding CsgD family transcriptional regulator